LPAICRVSAPGQRRADRSARCSLMNCGPRTVRLPSASRITHFRCIQRGSSPWNSFCRSY
jgi:hypothetical protein